jgi:hypothetical protein
MARTAAEHTALYGRTHQKTRAQWAPIVDAGQGWCAEPVCLHPSRWIPPGTPWHLAHRDGQDGYRGPAHRRCNIAERNRRLNPVLNPLRWMGATGVPKRRRAVTIAASLRTSRDW